ncbi:nucleoside recognition domain-containing protein [Desulfitobacterium metallireducens]|uniref:Sporulation integral membrane protein YlbJ n=1 Tax=Desulfitobacterium metallireducens DSM 15288 TaxID=871968 RepID=W0EEI2_9FIRM|nr:nucleoside recognition domain-containing protein [Desulfitobacterium metallireducens]AHF07619.1 sporulation integral membrane protein YlbJ [Desulfitobacterium metallireducens DSM 15288]
MAAAIRTLPFFLLALAMFLYPQEVVSSAATGLTLWWTFVLPALLPFFILSELLMGAGFIHFLGILLEPLMRPFFHLPGKASFVMAMGYTSGIPIGAVLTCKLRQQNQLTQIEGERLLAFTSNPSPGFMFGAVASGMLGRPELGLVLAGAVYLSNLIIGILFRFYRYQPVEGHISASISLKRAWQELLTAQDQDGRPFGQLLGDAVRQSVQTVLLVGGFITFFSVLINLLNATHLTTGLALILESLTGGHFTLPRVTAGVNALFETTLGCRTSLQAFSGLNVQVAVLSAVLAWGGLSVFAQVASFTSLTDLRFSAFLLGRVLQSILAPILSQILLLFIKVPASSPLFPISSLKTATGFLLTWRLSVWVFCGVMIFFLISALGVRFLTQK